MLNFCHIYAFNFSFLFVFCLFYNQGLVSFLVSQTDMNDKEDTKKTTFLVESSVTSFSIITRRWLFQHH